MRARGTVNTRLLDARGYYVAAAILLLGVGTAHSSPGPPSRLMSQALGLLPFPAAEAESDANGLKADSRSVDPRDLDEFAALAVGYLVDACGPDGKFRYLAHIDPDRRPAPKYNMLRHAGTMYALATYARSHDEPAVLDTLERARGFLLRTAVKPVGGDETMLAVWTVPEITGQDYWAPVAKLGGTGLALIALTSLEQVQPGATSPEMLTALARFVCYMQKGNGSFYSKYIPYEGGRSDKWVSLYYPGEAILGLMLLYERDSNPDWLEAATRGMAYLAVSREGQRDVPPDHWALIASERLLAHLSDDDASRYGKAFVRHAEQICDGMLRVRPTFPANDPAYGCLVPEGSTCPTATRLEGMLAVVPCLPPTAEAMREEILAAGGEGVGFLLRSQLKKGRYTGGVPRTVLPRQGRSELLDEALRRRAGEIRIDYVQHALSAILVYREILENGGATPRDRRDSP